MKNIILLLFLLSSIVVTAHDSTKVEPKVIIIYNQQPTNGLANKWHQETLRARENNKSKAKRNEYIH